MALTLRSVGGLTTAEIARGFLVPEPTMAQRLVRAKRKIASAAIPFRVPDDAEKLDRLGAVHHVLYLVFNEGTYPGAGADPTRPDLAGEAIRLAGLLAELMVDDAESLALHALCLLIHARHPARVDAAGDTVLLADQDRTLWSRPLIEQGQAQLDRALRLADPGPYQIEAAIQALHDEADAATTTDWAQIAALYHRLHGLRPTPIVALNRAVAIAERDGPATALPMLDEPSLAGPLADYPYYHAARAELLARLGLEPDAAAAYRRALAIVEQPADRRFLQRRLASLTDPTAPFPEPIG